jgi:putative membrane protein
LIGDGCRGHRRWAGTPDAYAGAPLVACGIIATASPPRRAFSVTESRAAQPRGADPDSRARTHLANERTFLAWLRTGAAMIALGLGTAQFLSRQQIRGVPVTQAVAIALVILGLALVLAGRNRYVRGCERIEAGAFRPASRSIGVSTAFMLCVGLLAIGFIVLLGR